MKNSQLPNFLLLLKKNVTLIFTILSSFENSNDDIKERKPGNIRYPKYKSRVKKRSGRCRNSIRSKRDNIKSSGIASVDSNHPPSLSINGSSTGNK